MGEEWVQLGRSGELHPLREAPSEGARALMFPFIPFYWPSSTALPAMQGHESDFFSCLQSRCAVTHRCSYPAWFWDPGSVP